MSFGAIGVVSHAFGIATSNILKVVGIYAVFGIATFILSVAWSMVSAILFSGSIETMMFASSIGSLLARPSLPRRPTHPGRPQKKIPSALCASPDQE